MDVTERTTAVGVFIDRNHAQQAIDELHYAGFTTEHVGFITRDSDTPTAERAHVATIADEDTVIAPTTLEPVNANAVPATKDVATEDTLSGYSRAEATAAGAAGGGVLGGILGAAASLLIPGFGPAIAGGILAATLGGLVIGAVAGGFVGALTQMGIPEDEAHYYEEELKAGRVLITVQAGERYLEALNILRRNGGYDATARYLSEESNTAPQAPFPPAASLPPAAAAPAPGYTPSTNADPGPTEKIPLQRRTHPPSETRS